ncbi:MAG: hypothetical protein LBH10_02540 [Burkholderiaceae bacterium]|nr:hypothetical protein [Burkholderiaceae bacterium]
MSLWNDQSLNVSADMARLDAMAVLVKKQQAGPAALAQIIPRADKAVRVAQIDQGAWACYHYKFSLHTTREELAAWPNTFSP